MRLSRRRLSLSAVLLALAWLAARSVRRSRSWGTPEHLEFLADRLVHVYGENPNVDYIRRAREFAADARIPYRDTWTPQPDHSGCGDASRETDWLPSTHPDHQRRRGVL